MPVEAAVGRGIVLLTVTPVLTTRPTLGPTGLSGSIGIPDLSCLKVVLENIDDISWMTNSISINQNPNPAHDHRSQQNGF